MSLSELATIIERHIQLCRELNGCASKYITYYHKEEETLWTIRIADHAANPLRVDNRTISFVIELPQAEEENEVYSNWSVNKKQFHSIPNQFFITEYSQYGDSILALLEYIIA